MDTLLPLANTGVHVDSDDMDDCTTSPSCSSSCRASSLVMIADDAEEDAEDGEQVTLLATVAAAANMACSPEDDVAAGREEGECASTVEGCRPAKGETHA